MKTKQRIKPEVLEKLKFSVEMGIENDPDFYVPIQLLIEWYEDEQANTRRRTKKES